jgi:hypothetical protein
MSRRGGDHRLVAQMNPVENANREKERTWKFCQFADRS